MSALSDLRGALETALREDAAVRAVLGDPVRLTARRSARAAYPNASWGRSGARTRGAAGVDLLETRLTLNLWVRDGPAEPVLGAVRTAIADMDVELPPPFVLVALMPAYCDVFHTRDSRVSHGVIRLRALMGRDQGQ
ncbi:DUF3168 domain-containing protein [Maricaulis sp. CAU 1757]